MRKEQGTRCDEGKTAWDWEDRQFPARGEDGTRWHRVADGFYVASLHYSRPYAGVGLLRPREHPGKERKREPEREREHRALLAGIDTKFQVSRGRCENKENIL